MDNSQLRAILAAEKADALGSSSQTTELSADRQRAMMYYLGNMAQDMPSIVGRSEAVSTDVADTVDGLLPVLMDILHGPEDVVMFEPHGPEDVPAAEQETDYINYIYLQKNNGFVTSHNFIKDALLQKLGIVKCWWDEREETERETYYNLTDDQYAMLVADEDIEIVEHTEKTMEEYMAEEGMPDGVS